MLCKRGLSRHALYVCVSARLSVTIVDSVKMNQRIFKLFQLSSSHTVLVFPYTKRHGNILTQTPLTGGVECRWGRQKSRFWANIWLHCVLWTVPAASAIGLYLAATDHGEFITLKALVSGRVRWWRETTTKCMTRSLNVTPKTTLRSGESEA